MVGFDHSPAPSTQEPNGDGKSTRYGYALFLVYLTAYGAYVLTNAFAPSLTAKIAWQGVNLAILSGLSLILFAFALAVVYEWLCRRTSKVRRAVPAGEEGNE
jgi:uncharacterized membrane protein (DUF485 family)